MDAVDIIKEADVLVVVGTSLNGYPAASLINNVKDDCRLFYVDPNGDDAANSFECEYIKAPATKGINRVFDILHNYG